MLRGTSIVAAYTLLSRVLGFVRDALVATLFGASPIADAYFVAFRIPNLLRSVFAEGALTAAFIPSLAPEVKKGIHSAQEAVSAVSGFLLLSTLLVSAVGIFGASFIIDWIAPGFSDTPQQRDIAIFLTQIMMPYIVAVSIVALLNGTLNLYLIFGASAYAQVLMNCVLIGGAFICFLTKDPITSATILAISVLVGGGVQVLAQLPALKKTGLRLSFSLQKNNPAVRLTARLIVPAIFGSGIYQLTLFFTTLLSSLLEPGAISWLFYADRIVQLPLGVFSLALASVLLPTLSKAESLSDATSFSSSLSLSVRMSLVVMVPLSGALYLFGPSLVYLLLERGSFTQNASRNTGTAIEMYSLGLWAVSSYAMISRAFSAKRDTKTPTVLGCISLILTLVLSLILIGNTPRGSTSSVGIMASFLYDRLPAWFHSLPSGHNGLALTSSIVSIVLCLSGTIVFHKRHTPLPLREWLRVFLSTTCSTLCCVILLLNFSHFWVRSLGGIIGASLLFSLTYFFILYVLKTQEIKLIFGVVNQVVRGQLKRSSRS